MVLANADAAETPALKLLRNIQSIQSKHPFLAPELLPPLIELGNRTAPANATAPSTSSTWRSKSVAATRGF
jgi:hypothetical protein